MPSDHRSHIILSSGVPVAEQCTAHLERTGTFSLAQMPPNYSRRLIFARTKLKTQKSGLGGGAYLCVCFLGILCPLQLCGSVMWFPLVIVLPGRISLTAQLICFHLRCTALLYEKKRERWRGNAASEALPGRNRVKPVEIKSD